MPLTPEVLLLLALAAFAAGFVDAIAGGGGLITLPALILAGLSPVEAIATNKLQGTFGVATSSYTFWRAGEINLASLWPAALATALGAAAGSAIVLQIDAAWLMATLPVLLVAVAIYFALLPRLRPAMPSTPRVRLAVLGPLLGVTIGFYDGFLGPGTGSFFLLGFVALGGLGVLRATANTKLLNFVSNVTSVGVFALAGQITLIAGLVMAAGQIAGSRLGARTALKRGEDLIRPLVVAVTLLVALKLLSDPANALGQWLRALIA